MSMCVSVQAWCCCLWCGSSAERRKDRPSSCLLTLKMTSETTSSNTMKKEEEKRTRWDPVRRTTIHICFLLMHTYICTSLWLRRTMTWASYSSLTPWSTSWASHPVSAGWTNAPSSPSPSTQSELWCPILETSGILSTRWMYTHTKDTRAISQELNCH